MLLTKKEAQERLRISLSTLDRHLANGLLTPTKIGGRVFFRQQTLERFIRSCERKSSGRARGRESQSQFRA
jgi:excisionase family DNA binding protein